MARRRASSYGSGLAGRIFSQTCRHSSGTFLSGRELLVLIAMSTVWGFHYLVIKTTVENVPAMFYAALRMSLVAMILAPWLRWRPGRMGPVLGAGLCYGALNYAFLFTGLKFAPASVAAIAGQLYVPFATLLSVLFLGEIVGWRRIAGIGLAFAGVAFIALGPASSPGEVPASAGMSGEEARVGLGVGLIASGAFIESIGAILVKRAQGFKPWELLAWFALIGTIVLTGGTLLLEQGQFAAAAADPWRLVGAIVYSAVLGSIFGHTAYYWLLQRLPVSQVAASGLLTPVLAVLFSVVFLHELLTARFLIGGAMALAGVGVVLLRSAKGRIVAAGG
jgi:O-acetylserine/cysteine efflux transporter